jgi:exosortase/archaeosortase family protein
MKSNFIIAKIKGFWKRTHLDKLNGLFLFLILYIAAHLLWHFFNTLFQFETLLSGFYYHLEIFECRVVSAILGFVFGVQTSLITNIIYLPSGRAIQLLPDCTGFKHAVEIVLILLVYPGSWKHKAWYIPLSVIIILFAAVIHFLILALVLEYQPGHFLFWHMRLSRWIFFVFFFFIWVIWEEKIRIKQH